MSQNLAAATSCLIATLILIGSSNAADKAEEVAPQGPLGTVEIHALEDGKPVPARIRMRNGEGKAVIPPSEYRYHASFVCDGGARFQAPVGKYTLDVLKGTEYRPFSAPVEVREDETVSVTAPMERWVEMNSRGWYSGDVHVHRPHFVVPSLMRAEEINLCAVQTLWNHRNAWTEKALPDNLVQTIDPTHVYHVLSEEDEREGGAIMFYNLKRIVNLPTESKYYPSSIGFIREAQEQGAWVEQEKPFWWEAPVNVAVGGAVSTQIVNNHFCEESLLNNSAWGRPRDLEVYPDLLGYAHYCCDLYYRFLNAGFPLVASAGSASGVLPNPIGYNRIYVDCGEEFSHERWWQRLAEGRNFVTNGPMLFVTAGGVAPGEELAADSKAVEVQVEARAATTIERIEIVADGEVTATHTIPGEADLVNWSTNVSLEDVSWLAVRCFEPAKDTIRYAHTGPVYIEGRTSKRKKESAEFFIEWMDELLDRIEDDPERYSTPEKKKEIRDLYLQARGIYEASRDAG